MDNILPGTYEMMIAIAISEKLWPLVNSWYFPGS